MIYRVMVKNRIHCNEITVSPNISDGAAAFTSTGEEREAVESSDICTYKFPIFNCCLTILETGKFALSQVPLTTKEEFKSAVSVAKQAFPTRRNTKITAWQRVMFKLQDLIRKNMDKLASNISTEQGKTLKGAQGDVARWWNMHGNTADGKDTVNAICDDVDIRAVSFVGSNIVIQHNMGAKNHGIVLPDAIVDAMLNALVAVGFGAAGRRCMALSTVIFAGDSKSWEEKLVERAKALKVDIGTDPQADLGPVIGNFIGPTILSDVTADMECYKEEIFGPVLICMKADSLEEAINIVNRNKSGNGAALFTTSRVAARKFQTEIEAGQWYSSNLRQGRRSVIYTDQDSYSTMEGSTKWCCIVPGNAYFSEDMISQTTQCT
ncbi:Methylmalonate-semialdehyde dehydrogenase [acylating], mitochondrial [Olea europaea subsp. europaea]|uniref:Methylmalonate-semialdehyde dehydrogenase [acylating], mitochondrial n=1 Tax=Olea europaea subsp. europaea TaxID=158383 RepID=A0A8S0TCL5_OLEEU|nr:Methylmalonate-semialdehyde dehydrogenase [acylating], mitochondrial [Olea europaea subsp. europaea]